MYIRAVILSRALALSLVLSLSACGGPQAAEPGGPPDSPEAVRLVQRLSSAFTGCAPSEHEITDFANEHNVRTWRARCRTRGYRCMSRLTGVQCAPEPQ